MISSWFLSFAPFCQPWTPFPFSSTLSSLFSSFSVSASEFHWTSYSSTKFLRLSWGSSQWTRHVFFCFVFWRLRWGRLQSCSRLGHWWEVSWFKWPCWRHLWGRCNLWVWGGSSRSWCFTIVSCLGMCCLLIGNKLLEEWLVLEMNLWARSSSASLISCWR